MRTVLTPFECLRNLRTNMYFKGLKHVLSLGRADEL